MKKIGMIIYGYPLGVSPSLINSAILLAQEHYEVHIFINRSGLELSKINFNNQNIIIHALDFNFGIWNKRILIFHNGKFEKIPIGNIYRYMHSKLMTSSILCRLYLLFNRGRSYSFSEYLYRYTKHFFKSLFEFHRGILNYIGNEYVCIIGVQPLGLIAASLISMKEKIPIIYFNLELFLEKECKTLKEKILKSLERECNKKGFLTIIQDKRRAKYLMDDNNIPEEKIVYVPVSALGGPYRKKSDYLYKILGISKGKKIILYAGNIVQWSMSLEIAEAAQKWNDDKVLILHTWRSNLENETYINQIRNLTNNKKVYLSINPVEWQLLPELLSSADIGLIFYQNLGKNFYETGSSSNKLAQYLQVGLPVITIDYPSFRKVIEKYECGKCTKTPGEIEKLANEIFLNYDTYRYNAFKCYQEKYEFAKHFKAVIDKIKSIS